MIDVVSTARTARQRLAEGLAALQNPGVPPQAMAVAQPVAQAMSAMHQIESTGGSAAGQVGLSALEAVRNALGQLQGQPAAHPAIMQATEAVAGSLGLVHQITQQVGMGQAPAGAAAASPAQPGTFAAAAAAAQPPRQAPPNPLAGTVVMRPGSGQAAGTAAAGAGQPPPQWQQPAMPAAVAQAAPTYAATAPGAQPAAVPPAPPVLPAQAPAAAAPLPAAAMPPGVQQPDQAIRVDAELGAHSPTNFYKGLSGNDVIDSGGIFIATYKIPEVGTPVLIKVSLPGGYEFESYGVVRWTRDAPLSGGDSPPGFGAQFTNISPEGRQLVYRYVRNREPLFHDDL